MAEAQRLCCLHVSSSMTTLSARGGDRKESIFQTAALLGGVVLARAVQNASLSHEILESVRQRATIRSRIVRAHKFDADSRQPPGFACVRMPERLRSVIAIATATPKSPIWPQSYRGVANLSLRASHRFRNSMRPTGEASGPVFGVSFALAPQPTQSLKAPGFLKAAQPSRVDSVERKLVVSAAHSKRFFLAVSRAAFSPGGNANCSWHGCGAERARDSRPNPCARR